jgi:hypothetical protein
MLLSGDAQSGTDKVALTGDAQAGNDTLLWSPLAAGGAHDKLKRIVTSGVTSVVAHSVTKLRNQG